MPQPASAKTYPFETGSGQEAGNAEWRHYGAAFGDGIVNDVAGDAFHVAPSSSDRTITVNLNELRERGIHYEGVDPTKVITLAAPTAGFTRSDRIVAHYDPADKSIDVVAHLGAEVNTGSPAPPALHRNSGGTWDLTLWRFTGGTGAASTLTKVDERQWLGWMGLVANSAALSDVAPIGSRFRALDTGHEWMRQLVSGTPTWVNTTVVTWKLIAQAASLTPSGQAPRYARLSSGLVVLQGGARLASTANFIGGNTYQFGQLDAGYRPGADLSFNPVITGVDSSAVVTVSGGANGGVITASSRQASQTIRLDGIQFPAEF